MITATLVAILGFLLLVVLVKLFQKPRTALPPRSSPAPPQLADLTVADARPGDTLSISGAGDDFSDLDFTIDRRTEYRAGQRRWTELGGMYRNRRVSLEVMRGDDLEVWAVLKPDRIMLEELGLSEDDMAAIDERQNTGDNFQYDGKVWYYRFSREITSPDHEPFYAWRFQEEGGKRMLTLRKPEGEGFSATLALRINPGDITVYRK